MLTITRVASDMRLAWSLKGLLLVLMSLALFAGCSEKKDGPLTEVNLGYFPNVTHAQALLGVKRGDFQRALGDGIKLNARTMNAGPLVIEAVYAGNLDMAYVGPSPSLNGFIQSKGEEVRVVAGAATNGVLVIGNKKRNITKIEQLKGGRVATPQMGNTQDISAKYYLTQELGLKLKVDGGDTDVIPMANPDIETLFSKDQLDAAWVPEPWGTRIIDKGLANLVVEEKDLWEDKVFPITNVIVRRDFLEKHPDVVAKLLEVHIRLTRELQKDAVGHADELNGELKKLTSKSLPKAVIEGALKHTGFDYDPLPKGFEKFFTMGKDLGFLRKMKTLDVDKLIVKGPLEAALKAVDGDNLVTNDGVTTESVK